ncbi:hypothetical protein [Mycolicibacter kumamotonensis]|uniref:Uncharacterized protein n=1 Tax=Mycolicibacter kumamotonensis TaxID=354243 RepID=A0A1B8SL37_9MYCO|nr:hypothetical protein [Mycolicibacter kumamotonensis]OBY33417.1 hypothetical protein ACT18_00175 [Mycolicibacter kumamotonensis]
MADAAATAIGKLDGRDPDQPNYPPLNWVGVSHYREVALGQSTVVRPEGADPGKLPGGLWWTPSTIDHVTVTAEILTSRYHHQTVFDMIGGLFAVLVEGHDPADVRAALNVADPPLPPTQAAPQE